MGVQLTDVRRTSDGRPTDRRPTDIHWTSSRSRIAEGGSKGEDPGGAGTPPSPTEKFSFGVTGCVFIKFNLRLAHLVRETLST